MPRLTPWLLVLFVAAPLLAACGEDDPPPPPPPPPAGGPPPPPQPGRPAPAAAAGQLQPRVQIEQKIICPEPEKPTGPACDLAAPMCDPGLYCINVGAAAHCEPCAERDTIRHEFKDRDFVSDQVRDPFQSFVIVQPELVEKSDKKPDGPCTRKDQFVATNYSYMDLRLVGIVSQGTQRKVLMIDRGNLGHIIRRGDCVGKEKAVVKDIGTGYVTFVIQPDPEGRNPNQLPEEHSVQLHPKTLDVSPQGEDPSSPAPSAPLVAPPGPGGGGAQGDQRGTAQPAPAASSGTSAPR